MVAGAGSFVLNRRYLELGTWNLEPVLPRLAPHHHPVPPRADFRAEPERERVVKLRHFFLKAFAIGGNDDLGRDPQGKEFGPEEDEPPREFRLPLPEPDEHGDGNREPPSFGPGQFPRRQQVPRLPRNPFQRKRPDPPLVGARNRRRPLRVEAPEGMFKEVGGSQGFAGFEWGWQG